MASKSVSKIFSSLSQRPVLARHVLRPAPLSSQPPLFPSPSRFSAVAAASHQLRQRPTPRTFSSSARVFSQDPPSPDSSAQPARRPLTSSPPATEADQEADPDPRPRKEREPHYQLTFTCVPCGERSQHVISKQGYHHGSVLVQCPECRNRHVISDHLKIFGDRKITVEDLMREKGMLVRKGSLGEDGDIEFFQDEAPQDAVDGAPAPAKWWEKEEKQ